MLTRLYAFAAFIAALLLFVVQPLLGKQLLPAFGGSPATFTTLLLFFQLMLLAGYALADLLVRRVSARAQPVLALVPIALALALLPLGWPSLAATRSQSTPAVLQLFGWLARAAGPVCLPLAATSPLLTHWYSQVTDRPPHALYAYSNAGSLLGLLAYPFVVEPLLSGAGQAYGFALGFCAYAACMLLVVLSARRASQPLAQPASSAVPGPGPRLPALLRWGAFAALSTALLLAVTNQLTLDIAAVPFLWVAPLALYLLSFVIAFAEGARDRRGVLLPCWVAGSLVLAIDPFQHAAIPAAIASAGLLLALFVFGLLCHGELARTRPQPAHLARFYLTIALGGAVGGLFVAVLAPLLFSDLFELQLILAASYVLLVVDLRGEPDPERRRAQARFAYLGLGLCLPLIAGTLWVHAHGRTRSGQVVEQRRGFHGVLSVTDLDDVRLLSHGRIRHGMQFRDPAKRQQPTLYYSEQSGAGRALLGHRAGEPRRIGVIGLGAGTLATYGRARDVMRFYELNPDVVALARRDFSFLSGSAARTEIAVGDARLSLASEPAQHFDLFVLDAFASDAVPVHLLTREAFALYLRHLRPDGLLLVNVSNRHLALERVVAGAAQRLGLALHMLETPSDRERGLARVRWMLLARDRAAIDRVLEGAPATPISGPPVVFSDDFSNLFSVLR